MTEKDKEYVRVTINNEGFHYAFCHYSDFTEINDEKFHELRSNYLDAIDKMEEYLEVGSDND